MAIETPAQQPPGAEQQDTASCTVYTIGHGNAPDHAIVALLQASAIRIVLDVRTVPYSQYTHQFNREVFANTLRDAGIDYRFAGQYLGGRPDDPTCYKGGVVPGPDANFLELVDYPAVAERPWFQKALGRVVAIAREQPVALMCSEEDPHRCHRHHLIAQALLDQQVTVVHIRGDGSHETATIEPRQLSLF
jgi:uncharacterized protein (DUF488 family)